MTLRERFLPTFGDLKAEIPEVPRLDYQGKSPEQVAYSQCVVYWSAMGVLICLGIKLLEVYFRAK